MSILVWLRDRWFDFLWYAANLFSKDDDWGLY